jgi:glycosyltransferase involved in cell wall biosynthesis
MPFKICFLSLLHRHDDTRIFYKEARSLAKAGFEVTHLAPGKIKSYVQDGVRIEIYTSNTKKGISGRLSKLLPLYIQAVKMDADCYHCNEIEAWPVGWLLKLFHPQKRLIFDVHEHYPSRFDNPIFPKWLDSLGAPFTKFLYKLLTPRTDHLIFVNPVFADDFPGSEHKQTTIYNYGLLEKGLKITQEVPVSISSEFLKCPTAIHIGGFAQTRGWPQLIEALQMMEHKELAILCLGDLGSEKEKIMFEAKQHGVSERINLKDRMPYEDMFNYLLRANVGLILYQPGIMNHMLSFPQKLLDYMLAGLPVVAPKFSVAIDNLIRAEKCGILINPAVPKEIAQALDWIYENPILSKQMGNRGQQAIIEKYNWEREVEKLIKIYEDF